jgi:hypothetical protein
MDIDKIKIWMAESDKDIDRLYSYEDDIEKYIVGTRDEWLGWLRVQVKTNKLFALIYVEVDGELKGYLVATKTLIYPVCNSVYIFYANSKLGVEGTQYVWGEVCDWARKLGADAIEMKTDKPDLFIQNFAFQKDLFTSLILRL